MAANKAGTYFGLDAQGALRVTRWLELYSRDRETFYASFINWAYSTTHQLLTAPHLISEAEKAVIESLRKLPMRAEVLMRNLMWYLQRQYKRDSNKPHEGPIRIAGGDNVDGNIRQGEARLYGLLFPRGAGDNQSEGARWMADARAAKRAAKKARRAERRAAPTKASSAADPPTTTSAYRPRDNHEGHEADKHESNEGDEEQVDNSMKLALRPKES